MKTAEELRQELAALEGQQAAPAAPETTEEASIKRIFDSMLGLDGEAERQKAEDEMLQVCASCFWLQRQQYPSCELCGESGWLVPSQVRKNPEHSMFLRMAAEHTVEQLRTALRSGWAKTSERERICRKLLASREARIQANAPEAVSVPEESRRPVLDGIDIKGVEAYLDYQIAQLQAEQAKLEQSRQESPTA